MEKAYKFRIYPTPEQEQQIQRTFGCCRFIFNHFLHCRIELYGESGETLNYAACCLGLARLKNELPWLREVDSTALQSSLKDLDNAYQNFFRRVKNGEKPGFPQFKSKHNRHQSYKAKRVGENIAVTDTAVKLPKLGFVRAAISKQVQGRILNATISQNPSGKYFVSICCTDVEIEQYEPTGAICGIDLGIKTLAVTSDGTEYENPKHYAKSQSKLRREQRRLSRKTKGSKNHEKQRVKVARVHEKTQNQRQGAIHTMTTALIRDYDIIVIEDLNIKGMVHNHKLAKAISDAAWGEVVRQLKYKAVWHDREIVQIDRFFASSQTCGECGYKNPEVKNLSVRQWICPGCKTLHDRDGNAAINILQEGLRLRI
jgi:putative transposase